MTIDLSKLKPVSQESEETESFDLSSLKPIEPPKPTTGEKHPLKSQEGGLLYQFFTSPLAPLKDEKGGMIYRTMQQPKGARGQYILNQMHDLGTGTVRVYENLAKLAPTERNAIEFAMNQLGVAPKVPTGVAELISRSEEGLSPEELEYKRKNELLGELIGPPLLEGLLKFIPRVTSGKIKTVEPLNPIQERLAKIDNLIKSGATEGEKAAAMAAKERLLGKYNPETGLERIAKATGEPKENIFKRIWDKTKQWSQETFGQAPDIAKLKPEEGDKFLEFMQQEEQALEPVVEKQLPVKAEAPPAIDLTKIKPAEVKPVVEKPPVQPPKTPPTPPSEPPPSEPPTEPEPLAPQKATDETYNAFSKVAAKLNVEHPFQQIGANETGFAVKSYFDRINKHIDQGRQVVKQVKALKLSKEQLSNVVLQAESATPPKDPKERKAWEIMRSHFDKALGDLKKAGVLQKGFHERITSDLEWQIKSLDDQIGISKGNTKLKLIKEKQALQQELKDVSNLRFVSIPVRNLFDLKRSTDPALTRKSVNYLNKKKRKTLTLNDLVESGLVKKEELTPDLIIGAYSRKFGRDMALAKVINSAKKEGLASLTEQPGYVKIPGYVAPELAKYWVNPVFADYIQAYTQPRSFKLWEKIANTTKGYAFYNPIVLSANDILQQIGAVLGNPSKYKNLPGAWRLALKDIAKKTPNYWEAYENGLFSSPFVDMPKTPLKFFENLKEGGQSVLTSLFKDVLKLPVALHSKMYDALQTIAWTGDRAIRMATYNYLRSAYGLSAREAAQTAALYHGDYSRVPAKTRRALNKWFMTPTFKMVMTAAIKENIKGAYKVGQAILKGEKVDPNTKAKAAGLLGIAASLGAIHLTMKSSGWDIEILLYRYKKNFMNDQGQLKTKHISFNLPFTLLWKFGARAWQAANEPGINNRLAKFLQSMKFETAIPIQIASEIIENKDSHWKEVYDPKENPAIIALQIAHYVLKRGTPLIGKLEGDSFIEPEQKEQIEKEFGHFTDLLTFMFPYVTDRDSVRYMKRAKYMMNDLKRKARKGELTERQMKNWMKEIQELQDMAARDTVPQYTKPKSPNRK